MSLGGAVGQQLALDNGERLLSLTVCASSARFADPPSWAARAATVRAEGTEALVASRTGTWWTAEFAQRAPQEVERLLGMLRATVRSLGAKQVNLYRSLAHTPELLHAWIDWAWALREKCTTPGAFARS